MDNNSAAHNLAGRTLKSGWLVKTKIERDTKQRGSTGSNFSVGYIVEKGTQTCFMKAFDFAGFLSIAHPDPQGQVDTMQVLNMMTNAFLYERNLSEHCNDKHVTKVSLVVESGQEIVPGFNVTVVPFLIFDLAQGDVRATLKFSSDLDYAWRFKSLHDIAVGLKQLHYIFVSHQDLKPSNILVYSKESKIGDLGRSVCKDLDGPYSRDPFTGDFTYAPPEIWYNYYQPDWNKRVFATDCYMLGSLIVFYFTGVPMSALLGSYIPANFSHFVWQGSFEDIVPYLEDAFSRSLNEFEGNISNKEFRKDLRKLVEYLCNPFPEKRGHPKNIISRGSNFNLERFVTQLEVLKRKAELIVKNQ